MKVDHWNRKRQQSAQEYIQLVYSKGISYYQKRLMKTKALQIIPKSDYYKEETSHNQW